jgi:hypothetical protein
MEACFSQDKRNFGHVLFTFYFELDSKTPARINKFFNFTVSELQYFGPLLVVEIFRQDV